MPMLTSTALPFQYGMPRWRQRSVAVKRAGVYGVMPEICIRTTEATGESRETLGWS